MSWLSRLARKNEIQPPLLPEQDEEQKLFKTLNEFISNELWPVLKQEGYIRSGKTFRRVTDTVISVVAVRSYLLHDHISFDICLGTYYTQIASYMGSPNNDRLPKIDECMIFQSLKTISQNPFNIVHWKIYCDTDMISLARYVVAQWERHGRAWLRRYSDLREARKYFLHGLFRNYMQYAIIICLLLGENNKAEKYFRRLYWQTFNGIQAFVLRYRDDIARKLNAQEKEEVLEFGRKLGYL